MRIRVRVGYVRYTKVIAYYLSETTEKGDFGVLGACGAGRKDPTQNVEHCSLVEATFRIAINIQHVSNI